MNEATALTVVVAISVALTPFVPTRRAALGAVAAPRVPLLDCFFRYLRTRFAIICHSSSSPSPPCAETGRAAIPKVRSRSLRLRARSARESLSIFVATM